MKLLATMLGLNKIIVNPIGFSTRLANADYQRGHREGYDEGTSDAKSTDAVIGAVVAAGAYASGYANGYKTGKAEGLQLGIAQEQEQLHQQLSKSPVYLQALVEGQNQLEKTNQPIIDDIKETAIENFTATGRLQLTGAMRQTWQSKFRVSIAVPTEKPEDVLMYQFAANRLSKLTGQQFVEAQFKKVEVDIHARAEKAAKIG